MIDTHAHIYLPEFDGDRADLLAQAAMAGVEKILLPAIDNSTHNQMLATEKEFGSCVAMMGLHPCSVKEDAAEQLMIVKSWLDKRKFIAVGEIGLDFYWDKTFTQQQYDAFHQQIQWSVEHGLPIVIHSRNATDECIDVVKQYPKATGVFHCFSGTATQAQTIIDLGFYLGIGGVITFKNSGLDKVVAEVGLEKLVLETDAPYLAPVPFRGKRNQPQYLRYVVAKIAEVTGESEELIKEKTTKNANVLFALN